VTNLIGWRNMVMRMVGAEPKENSGKRAERLKWANYVYFEEDVDDIGDSGFEDETIGHQEGFRQPRNQRDFGNRTRGQFSRRGNFCSVGRHDDLDAIKLKIPSFQGKNDPEMYLDWEKRVDWIFYCHNYSKVKKVKLVVDANLVIT